MIINFPPVGIHGGKAIFAAIRCNSAEGGTTGKNTSTDQRQSQNTTGTTGNDSPNLTAQDGGSLNLGTQGSTQYGNVEFTDLGAVEKAFQFGEASLGILAGNSDKVIATQKSNTDFLNGVLGSFQATTNAGQSANNNKTLLYLGLGIAAFAAFIFLRR